MDYIRTYAETYDDWDQLLPFAMFAYNISIHEVTKFTPFEIVFGKTARTPSLFPDPERLETYEAYLQELILRLSEIKLIAAKNLITAKEHSKENYGRKVKPVLGNVGDQVYVQREAKTHGKLDNKYHGPYTLIKILDKNNAILEKPDGKLFQKHFNKLKIVNN